MFPQNITYTYTNGEYKACIDHVIVQNSMTSSIIKCDRMDDPLNMSDHNPMILSIGNVFMDKKEVNKSFHRFKWDRLEFVEQYASKLDKYMRDMFLTFYSLDPSVNDLNECIKLMNKNMLKSAREAERELGLANNKHFKYRLEADNESLREAS